MYNYISGTKTIIFDSCNVYSLNIWLSDFVDVENIIIVKLIIDENNLHINNLPITLKSLIIGKLYCAYPMKKIKRNDYFKYYCKLPFCCEGIKGKVHHIYSKTILKFKYVNNFKDFNFETVLKRFYYENGDLFTPHTITNKGKYYELTIT